MSRERIASDADALLRAHTGLDVRSFRRMLRGLNRNHSDHPDFASCRTDAEAEERISALLTQLRR